MLVYLGVAENKINGELALDTSKKPKEQALEDINTIWEIIHIARECFEFCKYLNAPPTEEERRYLKINSANARSFELLAIVL